MREEKAGCEQGTIKCLVLLGYKSQQVGWRSGWGCWQMVGDQHPYQPSMRKLQESSHNVSLIQHYICIASLVLPRSRSSINICGVKSKYYYGQWGKLRNVVVNKNNIWSHFIKTTSVQSYGLHTILKYSGGHNAEDGLEWHKWGDYLRGRSPAGNDRVLNCRSRNRSWI